MVGDAELTLDYVPEGAKVRIVARLAGTTCHADLVDPGRSRDRETFVNELRRKLPALDASTIEGELLRIADTAWTARQQKTGNAKESGPTTEPPADDPAVVAEAERYLSCPNLLSRLAGDIERLGVAGERSLVVTLILTGVSRLLDSPLALIIQGASSSGKSYAVSRVAETFPPDAIVMATQMTPQALFHMPPGALAHRWVVAGERSRVQDDDTAEATRALREMLSAGRLSKLMPTRVGNGIETVLIQQEGPIAFVETATLLSIFAEDANRALIVTTDDRMEQTQRIIQAVALSAAGDGADRQLREAIIARHRALHRLIQPAPVVIPYAPRLGEQFGLRCIEARRAFPQSLGLVRAVALLHQRQRERDCDGRIVASLDDYRVARHLLLRPLSKYRGAVPDGASRLLQTLAEKHGLGQTFTSRQARDLERSARSSVYGWLAALQDAGALELVEDGRGNKPALWRVVSDTADTASASILPSADSLCDVATGRADALRK